MNFEVKPKRRPNPATLSREVYIRQSTPRKGSILSIHALDLKVHGTYEPISVTVRITHL